LQDHYYSIVETYVIWLSLAGGLWFLTDGFEGSGITVRNVSQHLNKKNNILYGHKIIMAKVNIWQQKRKMIKNKKAKNKS